MNLAKIGTFIKEKRKTKNLTQVELAEKLDVTEKAVSRWETGRGTPDISLLIPLSEILDVTVLELLKGEEIKDENKAVVEIIESKNKKIKLWTYLALGIANILMLLSILIIVFNYIVRPEYEYGVGKGIATVLSDSMAPEFKTRDTVIYNRKKIEDVKNDDIVVYYYPGTAIKTVHRVIDIVNDGGIKLITKGDNNTDIDNYYVNSDIFLGVFDHKASKFANLFLGGQLRISSNTSSVFWFMLLLILSVLYLDIIEMLKLYRYK